MKETEKLYVVSSTLIRDEEDYSWGPGIHYDYVLHYVAEGKGFFETRDKVYPLKKGDCFFIYPGQKVRYYPDPDDPWTYIWVNFNGAAAAETAAHTAFEDRPVCRAPDSIKEMILRLSSAVQYEHIKLKNDGLLRLILSELIEIYPTTKSEKALNYISAARRYIAANCYRHSFGVAELAAAVGVERSYLYRIFMKDEGISPMEYIISVRLENAKKLLRSGAQVKLVSYSVGYDDPLYFSTCFKKRYGLSPKEFMKRAAGTQKP